MKQWRFDFRKGLKLNAMLELAEFRERLRPCIVANFVDDVSRCVEDFGELVLQSRQHRAREITCAGSYFYDRELVRCAEIEIRFHEVVCEYGAEQRTCFRR